MSVPALPRKWTPGEWIETSRGRDWIQVGTPRRPRILEVISDEFALVTEDEANALVAILAPRMAAVLTELHRLLDFAEVWEIGDLGILNPSAINAALTEALALVELLHRRTP